MRVPQKVRDLVLHRDRYRCCRCGQYLQHPTVHHRQPRGMGGTKRRQSWSPANLLTACWPCHLGWAERFRDEARAQGWLVPMGLDPCEIAVFRLGSWVYLTDDGDVTPSGDLSEP